jgi:hypothetical protein
VLRDLDASDVVRLNAPEYDAAVFTDAGIRHHDLFFEDCTTPPPAVVAAFFRIVDTATGAVAVHCLAGLGRTGTLIGLYMMRTHGFTARAAMGWLRIMRPGSVIGEQQHYLCAIERVLYDPPAADRQPLFSRILYYENLLSGERRAAASASPGQHDSEADRPGVNPTAGRSGMLTSRSAGELLSSSDPSPGTAADPDAGLGVMAGADRRAEERAREEAAQVAAAMGRQSAARVRAGRAATGWSVSE